MQPPSRAVSGSSVECVSSCGAASWKGGGGGGGGRPYECSVLSCAWNAPRALTGAFASTAQCSSCSHAAEAGAGWRRRGRSRRSNNSDLKPAISYLQPEELNFVHDALKLAYEAHNGQKRRSGEPFIIHPVEVARILGEHYAIAMETLQVFAPLAKLLGMYRIKKRVEDLYKAHEQELEELRIIIKPKSYNGVGPLCTAQQIRTEDMDLIAERGIAAHYSGRGVVSGPIKNLPKGATVIDYAYLIHTEIGNKMVAAKRLMKRKAML
uniref:TGS domain-containing protein n=1 Tax=Leersia perrieri TaxID=77586 RepID=A0A0D9VTU7_9ORYZ